jgi:hypothetical protein
MGMGWDGFMEGLQRVSIFDEWRTYGWLLKGVSTDMINDDFGLFFFSFLLFLFFFPLVWLFPSMVHGFY